MWVASIVTHVVIASLLDENVIVFPGNLLEPPPKNPECPRPTDFRLNLLKRALCRLPLIESKRTGPLYRKKPQTKIHISMLKGVSTYTDVVEYVSLLLVQCSSSVTQTNVMND